MTTLTPTRRRQLLDRALTDLTQIDELLEAAMDLIHDSHNGHPRAARYDRDNRPQPLWCWHHQRDHNLCRRDAQNCGGEPVTSHDPTGDAATTHDPAATAQRTIDRRIRALATNAAALALELTRWSPPSTDMQHPDPAVPPPGWCTSCWRDDHHHEPVSTHYAGTLCRFCAEFEREHLRRPPIEILRLRHTGRRITQRDIDRHLATYRRTA